MADETQGSSSPCESPVCRNSWADLLTLLETLVEQQSANCTAAQHSQLCTLQCWGKAVGCTSCNNPTQGEVMDKPAQQCTPLSINSCMSLYGQKTQADYTVREYQLLAFPTGTQRTMGSNSLLGVDPSSFLLLLNTTVAPLRAHWQTQNLFNSETCKILPMLLPNKGRAKRRQSKRSVNEWKID